MGHRYRRGDRGPAVRGIRADLSRAGLLPSSESDEFDTSVDIAVREFQQDRGLTADGVVDEVTYRVLDEARWGLGDRLLAFRPGDPYTGDDVMALQRRLSELGFDIGQVDGVFAERTDHGVRDLQRNVGLPADGTCGPSTFKALGRLAPLVTGGRPDSLRAGEALRRAGTELGGKIVCLDPGHGADQRGKSGHGMSEADIASDIASRIEGRLNATGVRTFRTRGPHGKTLDDQARASFANATGANLMISLHADAHPNSDARGMATYYYGLDRPGSNSAIGEQLAGLMQRELVARTGAVDCRSHAKTWDLLRHTRMATVRADLGYLTNPDDAARLSDPAARDVIAEAVVVAVRRIYLPADHDAQTGSLLLTDLAQA